MNFYEYEYETHNYEQFMNMNDITRDDYELYELYKLKFSGDKTFHKYY